MRRKSSGPRRRACCSRVTRVASRRASGWISRRIRSRSALRAEVKSTCSIARPHGVPGDVLGPTSAAPAIRRHVASTSASNRRPGRCTPVRRLPLVGARLPASSPRRAWSTSVGRDPVHHVVRRPAGSPGPRPRINPNAATASPASRPPAPPVVPSRSAIRELAPAGRPAPAGPSERWAARRRRSASRSSCVEPARPRPPRPAAGSRGRRPGRRPGRWVWRLTSVAAYAARSGLAVVRARAAPTAATASRPSASETGSPRPAAPRRRRCAGRAGQQAHRARSRSSLDARSWSLACLSTTPSVWRVIAASSRSPMPSATQGAGPVDRSRRSTATSAARGRAAGRRSRRPARRARLDLGHLRDARSRARARRRGSRGAGTGSAA